MEFHLEKPKEFVFKAGQNCDFTIPNPPENDAEGSTRPFSLSVSPKDADIAFTTRMRDTAFKRIMKNAQPGMAMEVDGPMGNFTLHENTARPAIFLIGGIGITPIYSMIKDATEKNLPHKLFLFYSNRRPEDTAFLKELQDLAAKNKNFTFVSTMTQMDASKEKWTGETGYITYDMVSKYVSDRANALYYLAGPQAMVGVMRQILEKAGISSDDIKTEEFSGY